LKVEITVTWHNYIRSMATTV